ncbi:hypothetical protein PT974_07520 [Cladobotryum mycophilum]|uniref:2EXR domain-containing protein n=1 Tax=Cladobotryum mycophilum TaxID=491253 RepID=A0ABR0SQR8_9HYPO
MNSIFHLFTKLPIELRLQIWETALRPLSPGRPGAHFFSVSSDRDERDALLQLSLHCHLADACEKEHSSSHRLSAPLFTAGENGYSWTTDNPSAYLWDFGMWGACMESKRVIEKHYNVVNEVEIKYSLDIPWGNEPLANISVLTTVLRENGRWNFTIRPYQDLVCLQPLDPDTIGWNDPGLVLDYLCMANREVGLHGFRNLAIEYDPCWNKIGKDISLVSYIWEKGMLGYFTRAVDFMAYKEGSSFAGARIWLIDYGLKRIPEETGSDVEVGPCKKFYGMDRVFTEVTHQSRHNYTCDTPGGSAFDLLDELTSEVDEVLGMTEFYLGHENDGEDCFTEEWRGPPYCIMHGIRVLACEVYDD